MRVNKGKFPLDGYTCTQITPERKMRVNIGKVEFSSWWILKMVDIQEFKMRVNKSKVKLLSWWVYMYSGW